MRFFFLCLPLILLANPKGEKVVSGEVAFSRAPAHLEAVQSTEKAVVEWEHFSVDCGETVRFVQPHSHASILNRVMGGELSEIYGRIEANGQVLLLNSQGIFFHEGGTIDVGSFLAGSLDLDNQDFLRGENLIFSGDASRGAVENEGSIIARDGHVILLAPKVLDRGTIDTPKGNSYLIQGKGIWIRSLEDPFLKIMKDSIYQLGVHTEEREEADQVVMEGERIFLVPKKEAKGFFRSPRFWLNVANHSPGASAASLESLQQLRDEIPERLWFQEFSLNLNRNQFCASMEKLLRGRSDFDIAYGQPACYFLQATLSGETIRILDRYSQFLNSPFWDTPPYMKKLEKMKRQIWKREQ